MKKLHLIRHAKSSWADPSLTDRQRPLNKRGYRACQLMARPIVNAGCDFRTVFCSPAHRAQLTIEGLSAALPELSCQWSTAESLYTFDANGLWQFCQSLDVEISELVLVGHNPAMTQFCNDLSGAALANIPTCGYVQLVLPIEDWSELSFGIAELREFLTPKMLA